MPAKIPDQTKTTIKGGNANVKLMATGDATLFRFGALLLELRTNASMRPDIVKVEKECRLALTRLEQAIEGTLPPDDAK